jgi:hypothetical protein
MKSLLILAVFLFSACSTEKHENPETHESVQEVNVDEIPSDIHVPVKMWDDIEGGIVAFGEKAEVKKDPKEAEDDLSIHRSSILFSPVTVILKEHNNDVLSHNEIRIMLPRGGGKIDLSQYMGESPGSFFVRFEWPEWTEIKDVRSFYVSRARKRKLDGDVYGVGCNKYLELSSMISKSPQGIKVNTTRDRHTTVLGGHFVFSVKKDSQTFLTQVTFTDSKNSQLFCEEPKTL